MYLAKFDRSRLGGVITITGKLSFESAKALAECAQKQDYLRAPSIIDMQGVEFIGSSGISAFISAILEIGQGREKHMRLIVLLKNDEHNKWLRLFRAFDSNESVKVMHKVRTKKAWLNRILL